MTERFLPALQQFLLLAGGVFTVGCAAWYGVVLPRAARTIPAGSAALSPIGRRVARAGSRVALLLIGAWVLKMVVQVMGFRDPFVPLWEDVSFLLFETFWGTVWMAQGVILPLLALAFWLAGEQRGVRPGASGGRSGWWWCAIGLSLALVATLALSSHAMSAERGRPVAVVVDGIHALAAGTWIGSLVVILTLGRSSGLGEDDPLFVAQIRAFSPMAIASVGALLLMGVALSWTHLGRLSNLWATTYGRVLMGKVALAGIVLLVGFTNWRKNLPASGTVVGQDRVRRGGAWEVTMAAGVLVLTAVLSHTAKPPTGSAATVDEAGGVPSSAALPLEPPPPGRLLYEANCMECHGPGGLGDGPLAASLPVRPANLLEHVFHHTDDEIVRMITNGIPPAMPPAALARPEILQIFEYLRTLVPEGMGGMEMPMGGMPMGGMPMEGMPMGGMPAGEMPARGMPMGGMPAGEMPARGGAMPPPDSAGSQP